MLTAKESMMTQVSCIVMLPMCSKPVTSLACNYKKKKNIEPLHTVQIHFLFSSKNLHMGFQEARSTAQGLPVSTRARYISE